MRVPDAAQHYLLGSPRDDYVVPAIVAATLFFVIVAVLVNRSITSSRASVSLGAHIEPVMLFHESLAHAASQALAADRTESREGILRLTSLVTDSAATIADREFILAVGVILEG